MYSKKSQFAIQEKNETDLDKKNDYPTIEDLMSDEVNTTVHHRRDLDSIG